jgi:regulator of protease activity HflC (stomatin/prohibitin superfamily)
MKTTLITKNSFNPISISILLVLGAVETALYYFQIISVPVFVGLLIISVLLASSVQIADQWEKAVVLRMGKYNGLKGPGIFVIIPIIDRVINYIDQRIRVTDFKAEQTLTKDTVPVNVVAVLYWTVWDVEKGCPGSAGI